MWNESLAKHRVHTGKILSTEEHVWTLTQHSLTAGHLHLEVISKLFDHHLSSCLFTDNWQSCRGGHALKYPPYEGIVSILITVAASHLGCSREENKNPCKCLYRGYRDELLHVSLLPVRNTELWKGSHNQTYLHNWDRWEVRAWDKPWACLQSL